MPLYTARIMVELDVTFHSDNENLAQDRAEMFGENVSAYWSDNKGLDSHEIVGYNVESVSQTSTAAPMFHKLKGE